VPRIAALSRRAWPWRRSVAPRHERSANQHEILSPDPARHNHHSGEVARVLPKHVDPPSAAGHPVKQARNDPPTPGLPPPGSSLRGLSASRQGALARPASRYRVDLGAHMSECDDNYERLVRLLPDLAVRDRWTLSMLPGAGSDAGLPVHLMVLERCPYTTTLRCSQPIGGSMAFIEPSLTVRMYHDARTAEVTEYQNESRFAAVYAYPNTHMRLPDEKVQVNRLLGDLLMLCLPANDVEPVNVEP
jgi:hypothetical protein